MLKPQDIIAFAMIFLKSADYQDDPQCHMSTAKIMTTALTAAAFFSGCHEAAYKFFKEYRYIPKMLSESRFSHRLTAIPESIWRGLADWLASAAHDLNSLKFYIADSFPVPVCKNIRMQTMQNLSGRMFQRACVKQEGIFLRNAKSVSS